MNKFILPLLLLNASITFSQPTKITGKITDNEKNPIAGVNIILKGTSNATTSKMNGEFEFPLPPGRATLLFHFIGFKPFEQEIIAEREFSYVIDVTLVRDRRKDRKLKSSSKVVQIPTK